jgi:hypothetical protein
MLAICLFPPRTKRSNASGHAGDARRGTMTALLIGVLIGLCGYLGLRLNASKSENGALRASVASLKRKLIERG